MKHRCFLILLWVSIILVFGLVGFMGIIFNLPPSLIDCDVRKVMVYNNMSCDSSCCTKSQTMYVRAMVFCKRADSEDEVYDGKKRVCQCGSCAPIEKVKKTYALFYPTYYQLWVPQQEANVFLHQLENQTTFYIQNAMILLSPTDYQGRLIGFSCLLLFSICVAVLPYFGRRGYQRVRTTPDVGYK